MIPRKSNRFGVKDVVTKVVRTLADGTERKYARKFFRVYRDDGRPTTVSMEFEDYFRLCAKFRIGQAQASTTMRQAAKLVCGRDPSNRTVLFSAQIRTCAVLLLNAQAKGVTLEEYEAAMANNNAWAT